MMRRMPAIVLLTSLGVGCSGGDRGEEPAPATVDGTSTACELDQPDEALLSQLGISWELVDLSQGQPDHLSNIARVDSTLTDIEEYFSGECLTGEFDDLVAAFDDVQSADPGGVIADKGAHDAVAQAGQAWFDSIGFSRRPFVGSPYWKSAS